MGKIRCGFVTNSSSSSYVIAYKKDENANPLYQKILDTIFGDGKKLNGVYDDPIDFLLDHFGYNTIEDLRADAEDGYAKKMFDKTMACVNNGLTICDLSIDYYCETLVELLEELDDGENFIILEGD
jgi:hypothetical protein